MEMNSVGGFFMKQPECQQIWQSRIQAFRTSGEASDAGWVPNKMYQFKACIGGYVSHIRRQQFNLYSGYPLCSARVCST
ncbi:MAG: hypothetical protein ABS939_03165 [Psychrobacillus sp.]